MWSTDEGRALFLSAVLHRDVVRVAQILSGITRIGEHELEPWDLLIEQGTVADVAWYLENGFFTVHSTSRHRGTPHRVMWSVFNASYGEHQEEAGRILIYLISKGISINAHTLKIPEWMAKRPLEIAVDMEWSYGISVLLMAGAYGNGSMSSWLPGTTLYKYGARRIRCVRVLVTLLGIARWRARTSPLHKDCAQWVARELWRRRYDASWK